MEIKVTIALDEKAHDVLNRLIAALGRAGSNATTIVTTVNDASDSDDEWTEAEMHEAMQQIADEEAEAAADEARKLGVSPTNEEDGEVAAPKPQKATKPVSDSVNASPKVTLEDLRALAADVKTKTGDIGKVKALLTEYSAKNISALPADKWDEFAARLKELL